MALGSAFTATVSLADQIPGAAPVITGRNVVGGVLTASVDTSGWAPVPDAVDYQWYLEDGTPTPGADQATLAATADLVGESVYVVATAHAADHFDHEISPAPTGRIAEPTLGAGSRTVQAGGTVTVQAWGLLIGEEYTVELHGGVAVDTLSLTITARPAVAEIAATGADTRAVELAAALLLAGLLAVGAARVAVRRRGVAG